MEGDGGGAPQVHIAVRKSRELFKQRLIKKLIRLILPVKRMELFTSSTLLMMKGASTFISEATFNFF